MVTGHPHLQSTQITLNDCFKFFIDISNNSCQQFSSSLDGWKVPPWIKVVFPSSSDEYHRLLIESSNNSCWQFSSSLTNGLSPFAVTQSCSLISDRLILAMVNMISSDDADLYDMIILFSFSYCLPFQGRLDKHLVEKVEQFIRDIRLFRHLNKLFKHLGKQHNSDCTPRPALKRALWGTSSLNIVLQTS